MTHVTVGRGITCNHDVGPYLAGEAVYGGGNTMAQVIQVEIRTGTTHTVGVTRCCAEAKTGYGSCVQR